MKPGPLHTIRAGSGALPASPARRAILEAVRRARPPAVPLPSIAGVQDTASGDLVSRFAASAEAAAAIVRRVEAGGVGAGNMEAGSMAASDVDAGDVGTGGVGAGNMEAGSMAASDVDAGDMDAGGVKTGNMGGGGVALGDVNVRDVGAGGVEAGGVEAAVREAFPGATSIAAARSAWAFEALDPAADAHALARLDVLVCPGAFGVAENGAVWLPESGMGSRAAPFLAQHLVLVLDRNAIVPDMHAACDRLEAFREGYGVFVAGPSKTADIEQALVIGAHGPRSLLILLT